MDTRGIYRYPKSGKYRVRATRDGITYMIGMYDDYDTARAARDTFLAQLPPPDEIEVPRFTKQWYRIQVRKQQLVSYRIDSHGNRHSI